MLFSLLRLTNKTRRVCIVFRDNITNSRTRCGFVTRCGITNFVFELILAVSSVFIYLVGCRYLLLYLTQYELFSRDTVVVCTPSTFIFVGGGCLFYILNTLFHIVHKLNGNMRGMSTGITKILLNYGTRSTP